MNLFTKDGTLHNKIWIATSAIMPAGVTSAIALRMLDVSAPQYQYDLFIDGIYQYSAPAQTLKMAELFIGNTPIVFKE